MLRPKRRAARLVLRTFLVALLTAAIGFTGYAASPLVEAAPPSVGGTAVFPADNVWNRTVTDLPVHANSAAYLGSIGLGAGLKADFGSGTWNGGPIGIPYVTVPGTQPKVPIRYTAYGNESDPGPMPIPPDAPVEWGSDHHVIVIDRDNGILYELYDANKNPDGSWNAASGAIWSLNANALRRDDWTSADAAGLPIFPGLARYDEVAGGAITHALRFTVPRTQSAHLWPARHDAGSSASAALPPMGLRVRLRADLDISGYPYQARVILQCLKDYGMILADNGSAVYISGAPDPRWDNDGLALLRGVKAADLEVVDEAGLQVAADSARARPVAGGPSGGSSATLGVTTEGSGSVSPTGGTYPVGTRVRVAATPAAGWVFTGWFDTGQLLGYARTLNVQLDRSRQIVARFAPRPSYRDVPADHPAYEAVCQLGGAGIIRGYVDGRFGPADSTLRAQMAALIVRAMGWDDEDWGNEFTDGGGIDASLWRDVGTLSHHGVAKGYGDGTYGPNDEVLHLQTISFITRAFVARGWWAAQPDDPALYPNIPPSGARADLATYVHYAGPLPGTANATAPWSAWATPAERAWFALALRQAMENSGGE